jgi:hypothetical protein
VTSACRRAYNNPTSNSTADSADIAGAGPLTIPGQPPSYGHAWA